MEQAAIEIICQSCGMPLAAVQHFGTNSDNSPNKDYCCFCFQNGNFTDENNLEEAIEDNLSYPDSLEKVNEYTVTKDEAALRMRIRLLQLKRWQSHNVTHQEYYKAINKVVDHINKHLCETINLYDLANIVNISGFHFHRIFKSVMGESPGGYIQRLRLEKAIFKLQTTQLTISEISEQTGYQSPHALSKAFKKQFGVSPNKFRSMPSELTVPIEPMDNIILSPVIKKIKNKEVVYIRVIDPFRKANAYIEAWQKLIRHTKVNGIPDKEFEYLSFSCDVSTITRPELCRIYACITNAGELKPKGQFGVQTINGGLYAVFTYKGAYTNLEALYCNIYRNWIPNSNYILRDVTFFEKYLNSPDLVAKEELLTEVYIPVTPV